MELHDICGICRISMLRKRIARLQPCRHLFHRRCVEFLVGERGEDREESLCPICRGVVTGNEEVHRKVYEKYTRKDREMVVGSANRGEDWVALSQQLGIKYKTAYHWVRSGQEHGQKKGGRKPKVLSDVQVDTIVRWIEENSTITLVQIQQKILNNFNLRVSVSTIGNYLDGKLFTVKQVHHEPVPMNSPENKNKRAEYVRRLNELIAEGKQVVWIDQTNFNLFCRRTRGRARIGNRAVQIRPAAKGPNIHLIGAISAAGILAMDRRRGSFTAQSANEWVSTILERWREMGNQLADLVLVADNAPCHASLQNVLEGTRVTLLKLSPYSPMLNPIEIIWSKIKTSVKRLLGIPGVIPPGVVEQRLLYLERIIDEAKTTVAGGDCARAAQHTTTFHPAALRFENMLVGE